MSITIVRPCSQADVKRLESSIAVMEALGGLQNHTVIFACAPSVHGAVIEMAARIRAICPQTFVDALPREPEPAGKFGAFNSIFRDSVELLYKRENKNPWLWMEADTDPIRGGWADRLELEYRRAGQPFCGVRRKASDVMRTTDGKPLDSRDPRAQGDYMVAVGMYPPNFKDFSVMYKYPDPTGNMPTDVNIRHEVNKKLHHTAIIGHHWGTVNYRRVGDAIVCDDRAPVPTGQSYAGEVSPMAFIVHGCKDDSLANLILTATPPNIETMPQQTPLFQGTNPDLTALKKENDELRRDILAMQEQWRVKENSYAEEIERLKEMIEATATPLHEPTESTTTLTTTSGNPAATADIVEKPVPSIEAVKQHLREAKRNVRLGDLAADFGCNKRLLRDLLETDAGINIGKGGLAWVSLAA